MSATFGRLNGSQLDLQPGLNVICAPNESGKSTWCRFLQNMLYGVPTKERGLLADKNKPPPPRGAPPLGGRLLLRNGDARYTLLRETRRTSAPMGDAHLTYTGTADPVPGILAAEAGQYLLGIPREVFLRSAFIGQNALAVDQDAELERRIAALISTGEEDASYSESYERLKKAAERPASQSLHRADPGTGAGNRPAGGCAGPAGEPAGTVQRRTAPAARCPTPVGGTAAARRPVAAAGAPSRPSPIRGGPSRSLRRPAAVSATGAALRCPAGRGDALPVGGTSCRSGSVHRRPAAGHGASGPAAPAGRRGHGPLHGTPPLSRRRAAAAKPPVRPDGPARTIEAAPCLWDFFCWSGP